jgi:hypothetical protein
MEQLGARVRGAQVRVRVRVSAKVRMSMRVRMSARVRVMRAGEDSEGVHKINITVTILRLLRPMIGFTALTMGLNGGP